MCNMDSCTTDEQGDQRVHKAFLCPLEVIGNIFFSFVRMSFLPTYPGHRCKLMCLLFFKFLCGSY